MFKRLLARLFGRKPTKPAATNEAHTRKVADAMIVEIAKRPAQPIHRNTFTSGPARRSDAVDITSPMHPAYMATMVDSDPPRSHSCHSSHDSSSYDSGGSDSGSSSGGSCD